VPHLVLVETLWVLDGVYDRTAEQIIAAVDRLLNHKELTIQDAEVVTDALAQFKKRPALGFSDCLVFEVARKAGHIPLGTFDRNLSKLDGAKRLE
jgi:predicted nucleic-acid-binding protein